MPFTRHANRVSEPQPPPPASPRVLAHGWGRLVYFPAWMRDAFPFQPGDRLVATIHDDHVTLTKE